MTRYISTDYVADLFCKLFGDDTRKDEILEQLKSKSESYCQLFKRHTVTCEHCEYWNDDPVTPFEMSCPMRGGCGEDDYCCLGEWKDD